MKSNLKLGWSIYKYLFTELGLATDYSYILHVPSLNQLRIGASPQEIITYTSAGDLICKKQNKTKVIKTNDQDVLQEVSKILNFQKSYFYIASLDLKRTARDSDIPLITFIQPGIDIYLSGNDVRKAEVVTEKMALHNKVLKEIQEIIPKDYHSSFNTSTTLNTANYSMEDWEGERDEAFLSRIKKIVPVVQKRDTKIFLTRGYSKKIKKNLDPFQLYQIYSLQEPNCAASHFLHMPDNIFSMGCSPENIFEVVKKKLFIDVVSATRAVSSDATKDSRLSYELSYDTKEQSEHDMAINQYKKQLDILFEPDTMHLEKEKLVRQLRNVRHLHYIISGNKKENIDFFDIFDKCFPALNAYLPELSSLADPMKDPTRFYGGIVGHLMPGWEDIRCYQNLRSILIKKDTVYTNVGMGIVPQSVPENELLEVKNKLRSIVEAITFWEKA